MADFTQTDWYRHPYYYGLIFDCDTHREADFLEAVLAQHGPRHLRVRPAHILEPACGNGRLIIELARRGHRVAGFDATPEMVAFATERMRGEPARVRSRVRMREDRMESFRMRGPFDLAHCLLSTFKHLLTEEHALTHLRCIARVLAPGGLHVLGIHLTDYSRRATDREVWTGAADGVRVTSETITRPARKAARLEALRNRMRIRRKGERRIERLETHWQCRTYDAAELEELIERVPSLEPVACYDFSHDIDSPRALDDSQEDAVVVLRKRTR